MTIEELSEEMRKAKAKCVQYCGTWNREDHDCEIFGCYHPSPARCKYFLAIEVEKRNKLEDEK